ncbi:MAG: hypothetical protein R3B90_13680 [Planctomycetaceae bacterium]
MNSPTQIQPALERTSIRERLMTSPLLRYGRYAVTVGLMLYLIRGFDWSNAGSMFLSVSPVDVAATITLVGIAHLLLCVSAWLYFRQADQNVAYTAVVFNHLRGLFVVQFVPTAVMADAYRLGDLSTRVSGLSWRVVASMLLTQRVCGLLVACGILATFCRWRRHIVATSAKRIEWTHRQRHRSRQSHCWGGSSAPKQGSRTLALAGVASGSNSDHGGRRSGPCHVGHAATDADPATHRMARGLSIQVGLDVIAVVVALSLLAVVVPISINGLGVREAVYAFVLGQQRVASDAAVCLALAMLVIATLYALVGGALLWFLPMTGRASSSARRRPPGQHVAEE